MKEETNNEWNFQKDGKPYDELPLVVKRNPRFLYEYMRTGEMPDADSIKELVNCDIKAAKRMIKSGKKDFSTREKGFNRSASEDDYKAKEFLDEFFIKSGYIYSLFSFEELYYDMKNFYSEGPSSLKKIKYEVECVRKANKIFFPNKHKYPMMLWSKALQLIAEKRLKELQEYE